MAGARAQDTSPAKPISELSRHGMLLRSISAPLRSLANKLTEEMAPLRDPEGGATNGPAVTSRISQNNSLLDARAFTPFVGLVRRRPQLYAAVEHCMDVPHRRVRRRAQASAGQAPRLSSGATRGVVVPHTELSALPPDNAAWSQLACHTRDRARY